MTSQPGPSIPGLSRLHIYPPCVGSLRRSEWMTSTSFGPVSGPREALSGRNLRGNALQRLGKERFARQKGARGEYRFCPLSLKGRAVSSGERRGRIRLPKPALSHEL